MICSLNTLLRLQKYLQTLKPQFEAVDKTVQQSLNTYGNVLMFNPKKDTAFMLILQLRVIKIYVLIYKLVTHITEERPENA